MLRYVTRRLGPKQRALRVVRIDVASARLQLSPARSALMRFYQTAAAAAAAAAAEQHHAPPPTECQGWGSFRQSQARQPLSSSVATLPRSGTERGEQLLERNICGSEPFRPGDDPAKRRGTVGRKRYRVLLPEDELLEFRQKLAAWDGNKARQIGSNVELLQCLERTRNVWDVISPNALLRRGFRLDQSAYPWLRLAAMQRSARIQIALVQLFLRRNKAELPPDIVEMLPSEEEWWRTLKHLQAKGYQANDLHLYVSILHTQDKKTQQHLYFGTEAAKPLWLTNFLLRSKDGLGQVSLLQDFITHCRAHYCDDEPSDFERSGQATSRGSNSLPVAAAASPERNKRGQPNTYLKGRLSEYETLIRLLAHHCHRTEPRLCVNVADLAQALINAIGRQMSAGGKKERCYYHQCRIFNTALQAMRPQSPGTYLSRSFPNRYLWEAQKALLASSATLERPLVLDAESFRAIRSILAGQAKDRGDMHNARRQAQSWPPYILPSDGLDELAEPEENWGRTVQAGIMMQEAGFGLKEADDALNVLQGMTADGKPTIAQRVLAGKGKLEMDAWEASIRATRNSWEAWANFQNPPSPTMRPQLRHYGAMFEKLSQRQHNGLDEVLPGDRAINFPTNAEVNLAEHERARLCPPSVEQLYQQMLADGIRPGSTCLVTLVSTASSVEVANRYLRQSDAHEEAVNSLTGTIGPRVLVLDDSLLAAYVKALSRTQRQTPRQAWAHLQQALQICELCTVAKRRLHVAALWGPVLKNLSQSRHGATLQFSSQLTLLLQIMRLLKANGDVPLTMFVQFAKCICKIGRREMQGKLLSGLASDGDARGNALRALYDRSMMREEDLDERQHRAAHGRELALVKRAGTFLRTEFASLATRERLVLEALEAHGLPISEVMMCRQDVVRAEHMHTYMLALAYVGSFEEMAERMHWLVQEWSDAGLTEAAARMELVPAHADFLDTLCAFRILAEPMLEAEAVASVEAAVRNSGLGWPWPDEEVLQGYMERQDNETVATLETVLQGIQQQQQQQQQQEEEEEEEEGGYQNPPEDDWTKGQ